MKRILALLLVFVLMQSCAAAQELTGQRYSTFVEYYSQNITFLNDNTGRHMLPLVIASSQSDERDGRMIYQIFGDVLSLWIQTDTSGEIIEMCEITLTAPSGMTYGDATYADFQVSGFHNYALLMAMHTGTDAYDRYELVTAVEEGLLESDYFSKQVGVYALDCTRLNNSVVLAFVNSGLMSVAVPENDQINQVEGETFEQEEEVVVEEEPNSLAG